MIFDPAGISSSGNGLRSNNRWLLVATALAFPIWWSVVFLTAVSRSQGVWGYAQWAILGVGLMLISGILLSRAVRSWMVDLMVAAGYLLTGFTFYLVNAEGSPRCCCPCGWRRRFSSLTFR